MTDTSTKPLYMVQAEFDARGLTGLARALHLPLDRTDQNYIAHCALGEIFGDDAPGPFCVQGTDGRTVRLLAYSDASDEALQQAAQLHASPMAYNICNWDRLASKPMPDEFPAGGTFRFHLRACPVVRKSSAGKHHSAGAEVDAFLSRVWEVDDPSVNVDREEVYRKWLARQMKNRGGARPLKTDKDRPDIALERFSLERMLRRTGGPDRKARVIKRPAATLSGRLRVTDTAAFRQMLRTGIGRHKSFGFGMLKIRPIGG
jgi:CRISPR system Cascade subunit CasE